MTRFPLLSRRRSLPRPSPSSIATPPATSALVRMPSVRSECFPSPARSITRRARSRCLSPSLRPLSLRMMSLPRLPLPLPSPRRCLRSIPRQDWTFWLPPRRRKTLRTSLTTITLNSRGACLTRAILISLPRFPRQRPMPILHPRSLRLAPALPASLRVRLQRAGNLSTISRRSALPHARLPSRRLSLSSRQPRRHVSARRKSLSRTRLCSPGPSTLPKLRRPLSPSNRRQRMLLRQQRLSRLSSTSIAPCRLMPRSSIPR